MHQTTSYNDEGKFQLLILRYSFRVHKGEYFCAWKNMTMLRIFELQAFLSKTIDTPALDLPPLGDEVVKPNFLPIFIDRCLQEDLDEEELTSDSDCRSDLIFTQYFPLLKLSAIIHQGAHFILHKYHNKFTMDFHLILPGPKNFVLVPTRLPSPSD